MKRFRRGMTVLERQKLRQEILRTELERAQERAAEAGLTLTCIRGMQAWGETAAYMHGQCKGEEPGGVGCLCLHHDDNRGGVSSGTATGMAADTPRFT